MAAINMLQPRELMVNSYNKYIGYIKMMLALLAHTNMVCVCVSNTYIIYIYGTDWCVLMW